MNYYQSVLIQAQLFSQWCNSLIKIRFYIAYGNKHFQNVGLEYYLVTVKLLMYSTIAVVLLLSLALPVFSTTPPSSISVSSIREPLRVKCSAKGSPLPKVTWYKNNVSMHVINNVTEDEFTSELVIGEFQPAVQATYRCVARNVYNDTVETSSKICKSTLQK